jgi:glycerol dehydrogenase-like iron-containing ADH family enzyme
MNGYLTGNASLLNADNLKQSYLAHAPIAGFFDLRFLAEAPLRLIRSGLGDVVCSSTIKKDLKLSAFIFEQKFDSLMFDVAFPLEKKLYGITDRLIEGDEEAISLLVEILILYGIGMYHFNSSRVASQGEHMIAHLYNMFDPDSNAYHGEEIAVTSYYMSSLQERYLDLEMLPELKYREISKANFPFGDDLYENFMEKCLSAEDIDRVNLRFKNSWESFRKELKENSLTSGELLEIYKKIGIEYLAKAISWEEEFFNKSCREAHFTRDRFTFLDLEFYCK